VKDWKLHLVKIQLKFINFFITELFSIANCGGNLTTAGTFQTPNYPNAYPIQSKCFWHIKVYYLYYFINI
jgi:hypothetical protein